MCRAVKTPFSADVPTTITGGGTLGLTRCRRCNQRPVWRVRNNDIHTCKRGYHEVWNDTRCRIRDYHDDAALPGSLAPHVQNFTLTAFLPVSPKRHNREIISDLV